MRLIIFFAIFAIIPLTSSALEFFKEDGSWIITADNCDKLKLFVSNVNSWTKKTKEGSNLSSLCQKKDTSYKINISKILPSKINNALKAGVINKNGFNCWNFSLYAHDLSDSLRYSSENEFSHALETTGICKKIETISELKAGDIVALRVINGGAKTELHTYVYLDENIVIHKRGSLPAYPYEVARANELDSKYKNTVESACSNCTFQKDVYRCDAHKKEAFMVSLDRARRSVSEIECLYDQSFNPGEDLHRRYKEKSVALERLVSTSLETSFDEYVMSKDSTDEQRILNDINSWLLIKFQLRSLDLLK